MNSPNVSPSCGVVDGPLMGYDSSWDVLSETVAISHSKTKKDYNQMKAITNKMLKTKKESEGGGGGAGLVNSVWKSTTMPKTSSKFEDILIIGTGRQHRPSHSENNTGPSNDKNRLRDVYLRENEKEIIIESEDLTLPVPVPLMTNGSTVILTKVPRKLCFRCSQTIYQKELVEPRKGVTFHEWCLRCDECGLKLTLKTFVANPKDNGDPRVFCKNHAPQLEAAKMDSQSKGISGYQQVPKIATFNKQIRGPDAGKAAMYDSGALCIKAALNAPRLNERTSYQSPPTNVIKSDIIGLRYF